MQFLYMDEYLYILFEELIDRGLTHISTNFVLEIADKLKNCSFFFFDHTKRNLDYVVNMYSKFYKIDGSKLSINPTLLEIETAEDISAQMKDLFGKDIKPSIYTLVKDTIKESLGECRI